MSTIKNAPKAEHWIRGNLVRCVDSGGPNMTSFVVGEHYRVVGRGKRCLLISISDTSPQPKRVTNKTANQCFELARPSEQDAPTGEINPLDWPIGTGVLMVHKGRPTGKRGEVIEVTANRVHIQWGDGVSTSSLTDVGLAHSIVKAPYFDKPFLDLVAALKGTGYKAYAPKIGGLTGLKLDAEFKPARRKSEIECRYFLGTIRPMRFDGNDFTSKSIRGTAPKAKTVPEMIAEWRKGCGNTMVPKRDPSECAECTNELINAIQRRYAIDVGAVMHEAAAMLAKPDPVEAKVGFQGAPGYQLLADILQAAHDQAALCDRNKCLADNDSPFEKQIMQRLSALLDKPDGMAYEACKLVTVGMDLPNLNARKAAMLDAINHIAGIIIYMDKHQRSDEWKL